MRPAACVAFAASSIAFAAHARADVDSARAQAAFEEGRRLAAAGDYPAACARFEESQRAEAALGTLLNLADCYEREGRIASALRAFAQGAEEAANAGESKRAARAKERAEGLALRVSTIAVVVAGEAPGLEVTMDDTRIDPSKLGEAFAVDGGAHRVTVRAQDRRDWSFDLTVARESEHAKVVAPELARLTDASPSAPAPNVTPAPTPASEAAPRAPSITWDLPRVAGASLAGVGVVALGVGTYFGVLAISQWNDRQHECISNYCTPRGYSLGDDARSSSDASNIALIAGGAAVAAGATLFFLVPKRNGGVKITAAPLAHGSHGALWEIRGTF